MSQGRRQAEAQYKTVNQLNKLDQFAGNMVFPSAHFAKNLPSVGNELTQSILNFLPWWAIIHGAFQIYEGYTLANQYQDRLYTQNTKRLKGLLQVCSGFYLAEGGVEVLSKGILTQAPGLSLLFFRYMVSSGLEFLLAVDHLIRVLMPISTAQLEKAPRERSYIPQGNNKQIWHAFTDVIAKGLACAGWSALYFCGMSNPLGWAFLLASAACYAIKYAVPKVCSYYRMSLLSERRHWNSSLNSETRKSIVKDPIDRYMEELKESEKYSKFNLVGKT